MTNLPHSVILPPHPHHLSSTYRDRMEVTRCEWRLGSLIKTATPFLENYILAYPYTHNVL